MATREELEALWTDNKFLRKMMAVASRFTDNQAEKEDILCDAREEMINMKESYIDSVSSLPGLAARVVQRKAIKLYKGKKKFGATVDPDYLRDSSSVDDNEDLKRFEAILRVVDAKIKEPDRTMFLLRSEGMGFKMIAEKLNREIDPPLNEITFRVRMKRIIKFLSDYFDNGNEL